MTDEQKTTAHNVAKTIQQQILDAVGINTYFSWGVYSSHYDYYNGEPCLKLRVNALLHKGWVIVVYDRDADLYDLYLVKEGADIAYTQKGIYNDDIGRVIDAHIERKSEWSDTEYYEALRLSGAPLLKSTVEAIEQKKKS